MKVCSESCLLNTKYSFLRKEMRLAFREYVDEDDNHFSFRKYVDKSGAFKSPHMCILLKDIQNSFGRNIAAFPTMTDFTRHPCGIKVLFVILNSCNFYKNFSMFR